MTFTRSSGERARHAPIGQLFAADGLAVPVSITHRRADILLVILERADDFLDGPLTGLMLESTGGRGVLRTPGAAEQLEPNLLRFVIDDSPNVVQRREFVRVTVAKRVVLEDEDENLLADALTVDVSGGGMLVKLPKSTSIERGSNVYVTLYLGLTEYDDQVSGVGTIVRTRPDNHVGLCFQQISRRDQERLIRFVFERQRVALAVTRGDAI